MISSKTVEQLSNLDQVDHLSTNRTLRDGDCAVDADYFDFEGLFFFFSASVEVGVHHQPNHRSQGESMFISPFEKKDFCGFIAMNMNINGAIGGLIIMIMAMIIKMITMIIILITMAGQSGMLMKTSVGGSGPVARDPSV